MECVHGTSCFCTLSASAFMHWAHPYTWARLWRLVSVDKNLVTRTAHVIAVYTSSAHVCWQMASNSLPRKKAQAVSPSYAQSKAQKDHLQRISWLMVLVRTLHVWSYRVTALGWLKELLHIAITTVDWGSLYKQLSSVYFYTLVFVPWRWCPVKTLIHWFELPFWNRAIPTFGLWARWLAWAPYPLIGPPTITAESSSSSEPIMLLQRKLSQNVQAELYTKKVAIGPVTG